MASLGDNNDDRVGIDKMRSSPFGYLNSRVNKIKDKCRRQGKQKRLINIEKNK